MKYILSFYCLLKKHWPRALSVIFFILLSISYARIFAIGSPYAPGATLDPACAPGDTNCIVSVASIPSQTGNTGKFLTTNGTTTSWTAVAGGGLIGSTSTVGTETWLGTSVTGMGTASTASTVFIGLNAGQNATGADYSNFIGNAAGQDTFGSVDSNFIGDSAGGSANDVTFSNFIGVQAGEVASGATYSNFIGYQAGHSAGVAGSNFIGSHAGESAYNSYNSIFIGNNAGLNDTVNNAASSGTSILIGDNTSTGGNSNSIALGASATNTMSNQFLVAPSYQNWQIAGIDYVMPPSQGGPDSVLTNDGSGNLSWNTSLTTDSININGDILPVVTPNNHTITTVDSTGDVGIINFLTLGSDGFARISYYDQTNTSLKFAQCTNANCTTSNITTIDTGGLRSPIAMGSDGFARIAYISHTGGILKFAQCTNAACTTKNITSVDTAGPDISLAIGSDGFARISYYDVTNGDLKFAQCTNADCSTNVITTVDTGATFIYISLALGSDGFARISYYRQASQDLKFAQCTNADCTTKNITLVDTVGDVGSGSSIGLGSDGFARISYYDVTNGDLKFAQCTNADCSTKNITPVDTLGNVGELTSLAFGLDGFARISYTDLTNFNIKFAQCTNADCTTKNITPIDSNGNIGEFSSLAIGSDGFARISYYDQTNGFLKFFRSLNATGNSFTGGSNIGSASTPFNNIYAVNSFSVQSLTGNFDLAENYPTKDGSLGAGYIVSLDKQNPVFVSKGDTTSRVIGIVSTTPGSILGGYNDQLYPNEIKVPIALSGRVPLKVNLENGPINQGDDISLSSTPGVGKKAKPGEDTVGIALESYDGSQDSILVFVHLQTSLSDLTLKVNDLSSLDTTSATSLGSLIIKFLGDINNTITDLYAKTVHSDTVETKKLCVGSTCVTEDQFLEMVNKNVTAPDPQALPATQTTSPDTTTSTTTDTTATTGNTTTDSSSITTDSTTNTTTIPSTSTTTDTTTQ